MAKKCARTFSIVVEKGKKSILAIEDPHGANFLASLIHC